MRVGVRLFSISIWKMLSLCWLIENPPHALLTEDKPSVILSLSFPQSPNHTHTLTLIICVGVKPRQSLCCCDVTGIHLPLMTCGFVSARSLIMANLGSRLAWDRGHKTLQQPAKMKIMYNKRNTHAHRDRALVNYFHAPKSCIHFGVFRVC